MTFFIVDFPSSFDAACLPYFWFFTAWPWFINKTMKAFYFAFLFIISAAESISLKPHALDSFNLSLIQVFPKSPSYVILDFLSSPRCWAVKILYFCIYMGDELRTWEAALTK